MRQFARVFISRSGDAAIVVTMHVNEAGIWFEDETPLVLHAPPVPASGHRKSRPQRHGCHVTEKQGPIQN